MKNKLLIIGAGGHGRVAADVAKLMCKWSRICFLDDKFGLCDESPYKLIGKSDDYNKYVNDYDMFVAIGDNSIRKSYISKLIDLNATLATLIHPNAVISGSVRLGQGTVAMAGVIVNTGSTIGIGCILNTACTIDHDVNICDFVHISPGANLAGNVSVGSNSWIGIGSVVSNNVSVAENTIVGAGGVVIKNIGQGGTYAGVPVRRI